MLALVCATLVLAALIAGIGPVLILGMAGGRGFAESLATVLHDAYLHRVFLFTLGQAALSTLLSLLGAVPVARSLARRPAFPGRGLIVQMLGVPLLLPALVGVLALVALYGRTGWVASAVATLGGEMPPIYGVGGILLAHVFFNLPLAVRILLRPLEAVPGESWRLAAQLGFSPGQVFRWIDWPVLRRSLPSVATLIFLLCSGSFTIVLALGGGPRATTLEVALYEALRLDFDPSRAAILALLQTLLCIGIGGLLVRLTPPAVPLSLGLGRNGARPDRHLWRTRILDSLWLGGAVLFIGGPLLGLIHGGLRGPILAVLWEADLWTAALNSLRLTALAAPLAVLGALGLLLGARRLPTRLRRLVAGLGTLPLALPPIVIGTGWFILFRPLVLAPWVAVALTIALATLMALPYTLRALAPAVTEAAARHDRLCAALGLRGWQRFHLVDFPVLRRALVTALALAAALSLGDFGAVALFGASDTAALPLLLFSRMGSYRFDEAAVIALFLLLLGFVVFWGIEKGLGRDRRA
ncbi:thiamine/thiamine pyrophosphate ABC transporter permease [Elstera cyanobacteriorum]|uniref:thiamine/thiamine pyrophosphate ABC transporter permease n=1 Tax=Elstera cyanobacteriorum TaxID=2022747 RepID=UPI002356C028|nr:thiamine/thiamine pyrophosphate ABC transporter permease [Elstera cyanobacteriorum]MCK6443548.1 thiamine/thiamine pyrophosphate ABC transporter permease [Elstera cyanobacteriorum]